MSTPHRHQQTLAALAQRQNAEMQEMIANSTPNFNLDDLAEDERRSSLFESLSRDGLISVATNFSEDEVWSIYQSTLPFFGTVR